MSAAEPRHRPCASCPYRRSVPSGIWAADEYDKLPPYDRDTMNQPTRAFMCHQRDTTVCAGWLGHSDPAQLLAVRLGVITGNLSAACASYTTDIELFASGQDAADHGRADIDKPDDRAQHTINKLVRKHGLGDT